jgi:hypothetical protein
MADRIETVYLMDEDGGPHKLKAVDLIEQLQSCIAAAPEHLKSRVYVRIGSPGGALLTVVDDGEHTL